MEAATNVGVSPERNRKPKKRSRMLRAARREQLLAVANKIVGAEGIRGLTMERLSEIARISKPVVYSHFDNRSELLVALLQNYWDEVDRRVPPAPKDGQSFEEHLRESVHDHLEVVLNGAGAIRYVLHTVIEDPLIEQLRVNREQLVTERWAQKTLAHFEISTEQAENIAILYRGALEAAASFLSRFPTRRKSIEKMITEMGISILRATCSKQAGLNPTVTSAKGRKKAGPHRGQL